MIYIYISRNICEFEYLFIRNNHNIFISRYLINIHADLLHVYLYLYRDIIIIKLSRYNASGLSTDSIKLILFSVII